jgi:YD repeat-containing protein
MWSRKRSAGAKASALERVRIGVGSDQGRLRSTQLTDQTSDEYGYDAVGNVTSYLDRRGLRRDLTWDLLDRNTEVVLAPRSSHRAW